MEENNSVLCMEYVTYAYVHTYVHGMTCDVWVAAVCVEHAR